MINIIPNWHPIWVHFTVVVLTFLGLMSAFLYLCNSSPKPAIQGWLTKLRGIFGLLVACGVLAIIATITTGLMAYYSVAHDGPSHAAMTDHRNWALTTAGVFVLASALYFRVTRRSAVSAMTPLANLGFVLALMLVLVTAFKGGELVYRYGLGVMSWPEVNEGGSDGHDHGGAEWPVEAGETDAHSAHDHDMPELPAADEADDHGTHDH